MIRVALKRFEIVAVYDVGDAGTTAYLPAFDSVLSPQPKSVQLDGETLTAGERSLRVVSIPEHALSPLRELGVDPVVDARQRESQRREPCA
jgi:glyceraldehyde-3-phosphate dehydrogenase/erythrose-4-phosphate dehydrogenase